MKYCFALLAFFISCAERHTETHTNASAEQVTEQHRPLIHFTPAANWMNDPNGMVFHNNTYHLFYQYYPDSTVWGPMHWGHATSTDLVQWSHKPVALYPDSLGYIFSGSAVVDMNNTSGFGKDGKAPLVAIFTHHDTAGEKAGRNTYQYQSLAYSVDDGETWTKFEGNPVLKNPGIKDFRDPKVSWHEPTNKWIMTLAALDRIHFYSSPDLKKWTKESEFGENIGAHGGVWECPDLFPLSYEGRDVWILLVSINPGGPNGGSATQYFTGNWDGHTFVPLHTDTRWIDHGPDNYAGVTWDNTGDRKLFIGWMSNWQYAGLVPTKKWRSAMTWPRELRLEKINDKYYIASFLPEELKKVEGNEIKMENNEARYDGAAIVKLKSDKVDNISVTLSNDMSQKTVIGYDKSANQYYLDRTASGKKDFEKGFASRSVAPRVATGNTLDITLVIDVASVEMFADGGTTVMTGIFFPDKNYDRINIRPVEGDQMEANLKSLGR